MNGSLAETYRYRYNPPVAIFSPAASQDCVCVRMRLSTDGSCVTWQTALAGSATLCQGDLSPPDFTLDLKWPNVAQGSCKYVNTMLTGHNDYVLGLITGLATCCSSFDPPACLCSFGDGWDDCAGKNHFTVQLNSPTIP